MALTKTVGTLSKEQKARNRKTFWMEVKRHRLLYLFLLPCIASLIVFCYVPMAGILLAFKNYRFDLGIFGSEWAGLKHFENFISSPEFWMTIKNTLVISCLKLVICFPAPIILALLLNEVKALKFKKVVQTVSYLPNFVSWVVVVQLLNALFTPYGGIVNSIREAMGLEPLFIMGMKNAFLPLVVLSDLWKGIGWGSIVYLAAITGVDQQLYEAAAIDGANRWKCTLHITIPSILPTIVIMFIMAVGGILNAGYDQILLLQQPANMELSQVLDTYIIQTGIKFGKFEYATAIGLFKSVFALVLVTLTNYISKKTADISLW
ncbi:MAG: sugar ABC transporter permease [Clostridiales bacterium]|nr:sugar ABC transporter permease [Clostridiales bacterium]